MIPAHPKKSSRLRLIDALADKTAEDQGSTGLLTETREVAMMKIQGQGAEVYKLLDHPPTNAPLRKSGSDNPPGAITPSPLHPAGTDSVQISAKVQAKQLQDALLSEIGKRIDAVLGEAGVDLREAAGLDWSAEATAERIFSFAIASFGAFVDRHQELTEEERITRFESLIRGAVDAGARDAMAVLTSAGVEDQTRPLAEETMALVHQKFDKFFDEQREALAPSTASD
jgi:hypothetical protein